MTEETAQTTARLEPRGAFSPRRADLRRLWRYLLLAGVLFTVLICGLKARHVVWEATEPLHHTGDLENAYRNGSLVMELAREWEGIGEDQAPSWRGMYHGYFAIYDRVLGGWPHRRDINLDYPPFRLAVMTIWARCIWRPGEVVDPTDLESCRPLLRLNALMVAAAAIAAYLLVRHWRLRSIPEVKPSPKTTLFAWAAALLVWFNPGILVNAHVWPQWDTWVLPFFLFAALAGSNGRWLAAGLLCGIGIMFKGQLLAGCLLLFLWPVFAGNWRGTLRLLLGFLAALAAVQCIWLTLPSAALALATAGVCIALPMIFGKRLAGWGVLLLALWAGTVFLAAYRMGGSFGWIEQGFLYGVQRIENMMARGGVNNLPTLLYAFGWRTSTEEVLSLQILGSSVQLTIGGLLRSIYVIGVIACAIALARHARRNDARALLAMAAPWLLLYAVMPQMSSRYLMWAAAVTALAAGVSWGGLLLHLVLSLLSAVTVLSTLMNQTGHRDWWPALARLGNALHPGSGWMTLVFAGTLLYLAVIPTAPRQKRDCGSRSILDELARGRH